MGPGRAKRRPSPGHFNVTSARASAIVNLGTDASPESGWGCHDDRMAPVPAMTSLFTKIDHVGIAVPDLDEAIAFYRDTFGVLSVHEEVNEEQGVREAMLE